MGLSPFRGGGGDSSESSDSECEARAMGQHLGKHLYDLHGGAYHTKFVKGLMSGGDTSADRYAGFEKRQDAAAAAKGPEATRALAQKRSETAAWRAKPQAEKAAVKKRNKDVYDATPAGIAQKKQTDEEEVAYKKRNAAYWKQLDDDKEQQRREYYDAHPFDKFAHSATTGLAKARDWAAENASKIPIVGDTIQRGAKATKAIESALGVDLAKGGAKMPALMRKMPAHLAAMSKEVADALKGGHKITKVRAAMMAEYPDLSKAHLAKVMKHAKGGGETGAYEGMGRKKRAPAAPSSGRAQRAEIVKRVMAEHGMKMIEASKYVKQHGLY